MIAEGGNAEQVLRQLRALRRTAENLEARWLLSVLCTEGRTPGPGDAKRIVDLYRLVHR